MEFFENIWPQVYISQWYPFQLERRFVYNDKKVKSNPTIPFYHCYTSTKDQHVVQFRGDSYIFCDKSSHHSLDLQKVPTTSLVVGDIFDDLMSGEMREIINIDFESLTLSLVVKGQCPIPIALKREDPTATGRAGAGALQKEAVACLFKGLVEKKSFVPQSDFFQFQRETVSHLKSLKIENSFITESQLFMTKECERLVYVDLYNQVIWLKPPVSNPLALLRIPFELPMDLSSEELRTSLSSFAKGDREKSIAWCSSRAGRRNLGFVSILDGEDAPVGAKFTKGEFGMHGDDNHTGLSESAVSLFSSLPSSTPSNPISHWVRSHLSNVIAYPSFLSVDDLPPYLPVFREDNLYYSSEDLNDETRCGTFFMRIPTADLFLPITKSKTIVYNDKSPAILDILFKDMAEGGTSGQVNAGVRYIFPYIEKYWGNEIRHLPTPSDQKVKRFFQTFSRSRVSQSKHWPKDENWESIVKWVAESLLLRNIGNYVQSRLLYLKPPPLTLYFYMQRSKHDKTKYYWVSQRGVYHPQISNLLSKHISIPPDSGPGLRLVPGAFAVAAIHHRNVKLSLSDMDLLKWAAFKENRSETYSRKGIDLWDRRCREKVPSQDISFKTFDPIVMAYDGFDSLVKDDCNSKPAREFLTDNKLSNDYFDSLGRDDTHFMNHSYFHHGNVDFILCYICEALRIDTVILTTPFYHQEAALTEVMDVLPRDYNRLVWTGKKSILDKINKKRRRDS